MSWGNSVSWNSCGIWLRCSGRPLWSPLYTRTLLSDFPGNSFRAVHLHCWKAKVTALVRQDEVDTCWDWRRDFHPVPMFGTWEAWCTLSPFSLPTSQIMNGESRFFKCGVYRRDACLSVLQLENDDTTSNTLQHLIS